MHIAILWTGRWVIDRLSSYGRVLQSIFVGRAVPVPSGVTSYIGYAGRLRRDAHRSGFMTKREWMLEECYESRTRKECARVGGWRVVGANVELVAEVLHFVNDDVEEWVEGMIGWIDD